MKDKKRKFRFTKGAVSRNAAKQSRDVQFSYLNLPKGVGLFREEPKTRVELDILPYVVTDTNHPDRDDEYGIAVPGSLWYKRPYWIHRNVGPNSETVVCLASAKQRCPICEHRAKLLKEGADWNDDSVKALKPSMRNLYLVVPKGHKDYEEKVYIWDVSQFLFQDKLNEEIQENEQYETFPDLEEGYTLQLRFTEGQFGGNKFAEVSRIDFKERKKPYDESILQKLPSLDEVLEIPSRKAVEALFFSGVDETDVDEDSGEDEEEEAERRPSRQTSGKGKDAEEDDNDDEDTEEDDSEDGDKDTDEDSGEDGDEEEEEDTGKGKGTKQSAPTRSTRPTRQESAKKRCPYKHKFGEDCDAYEECEGCEVWEECLDASEN